MDHRLLLHLGVPLASTLGTYDWQVVEEFYAPTVVSTSDQHYKHKHCKQRRELGSRKHPTSLILYEDQLFGSQGVVIDLLVELTHSSVGCS